MRRFRNACLILSVFLVGLAFTELALARDRSPASTEVRKELTPTAGGPGTFQHSSDSATSLLSREGAGPDTFDLYGGARRVVRDPDGIPGNGDEYVEGKFESPDGFVPRGLGPSAGNWTGVDLTDRPIYWQVDGFNATNLNANGAGNLAAWCGLDVDDALSANWDSAPGYGNSWDEVLIFESDPVLDPSAGRLVDLDFAYNIDSEPSYDFFTVEYDSAGRWITVWTDTGSNRDSGSGQFEAPGVQFAQVGAAPIDFEGNDYGDGDRVRIRLRFSSDASYSDEDGMFDSDGAVQVDDIVVGIPGLGSFTEDFQSGLTISDWRAQKQPFAGDFSMLFTDARDIDPCAENRSPQLGFIDFGQAPSNGPGTTGTVSTGGSTSAWWNYGIAGGWVVNNTGGLDGVPLNNEVWSPPFDWDLPGPEDDGIDVGGSALYYSIWRHSPLMNGMFFVWHVRSYRDGSWGRWADRGFVYFSSTAEYFPNVQNTTDLIDFDELGGPEKVQIAFGVTDLAEAFGFPGSDSTPAPWIDDVRFYKYRIGGTPISARTIDLANDAFPVSGEIDVSTQAARDLLDVRFDTARDISSGDANIPGDSLVVNSTPVIPGTSLADIRMRWALRQNPLFESAIRSAPSGALDENFASDVDAWGRTIWTGDAVCDSVRIVRWDGEVILVWDTYSADLPDENFLYPGDILHYYFQSTDSDGRIVTLPHDVSGFGAWDGDGQSTYSRTYTVRALPTILDATGKTPSVLVYNDFGRRGGEDEFISAFNQLGLREGVHWDSYTTQGPTSQVSNGIGSAGTPNSLGDRRGHGANAQQLSGYSTIFYLSGNLSTGLLSDGGNFGGWNSDKSDDIGVLTDWKNLAGPRSTVYFGDFIGSAVDADSPAAGPDYLTNVMGVDVVSSDVRNAIDGQTAPVVVPRTQAPFFTTEFIAYGGCLAINQFDHITPAEGAIAGHAFTYPGGELQVGGPAASVVFDRMVNGDRKVDLTFPFGHLYVRDAISRRSLAISTRTELFDEILDFFDETFVIAVPTDAPARIEPSLAVHPNPFNPKTNVRFVLPRAGVEARVDVYDVRGQHVRTLHDGVATGDVLELTWNGEDDRGARVASGVYLVRAQAPDFRDARKVALVK